MDNHPETPQWTAARLATIAPAWEPDLVRAGTRLRAAPSAAPRRTIYAVAAATAALVVAFASPSGRAFAQDLWYRWFVTRVAVVRLDLSRVPLDTHVQTNGMRQSVGSIADAAAKAGFTPVLPPAEIAGGAPVLGVVGLVDMTQRIHVRALEDALRREQVTDVTVPGEWDGATLHAVIGPIVAATYPDGVEVLQTVPIRFEMPASFPLERFAEIAFRAGGVPAAEASRLAREYARQPAWLLDVPADQPVVFETVALAGGGSGLLIEDPDEGGGGRVTVIVSRPTRLYTVSSATRDHALRIANALP